MESESTRATLLPTSREYASNILSEISFWLMNTISHVAPLYLCYSIYLQIVQSHHNRKWIADSNQ
jgi:hypothetical protein